MKKHVFGYLESFPFVDDRSDICSVQIMRQGSISNTARELLKITVMHLDRGFAEAFRILVGIWSGPNALSSVRFSSNFRTPSSVTAILAITGDSGSYGSGMLSSVTARRANIHVNLSLSMY